MNDRITRYSAGVLRDGNRVLLTKRTASRSSYPGIWDFAGGHCEGDETFEVSLVRELREELGIEPTEFSLLMTVDESPDFILKLFVVTAWTGIVRNADEQEHEKVVWMEMDDARKLEFINGNYLEALRRIEEI